MAAAPCIFCEIVAGRAPAAQIYQNDDVLVFLDLFPAAPGHTLVIPKLHYENLFETNDRSLVAVTLTARRVSHALRRALAPDGLTVVQLTGAAAGQTVFHYHVHLIPRRHGDSLRVHGRVAADRGELGTRAREIVAALEP